MQELCAGFVIVNDNKYLLLHYKIGHWGFPKGHIEKGESPEQAAVRELVEETGIKDFIAMPGFVERIKYFFRKEGSVIAKEVVFFLARTEEKNVVLSPEHVDFVWLSFDDALKKLTFESTKNVLKKAEGFLR